jgi:hypothetical protein
MNTRNTIVARILLIDGILLIIIAFIHILTTPIVGKWFAHDVSVETLSHLAPSALVNQLVGILLIPFGISTLYCAMGIRAGQHFTRIIALINAGAVIVIPLLILFLMGPEYLNSTFILVADIIMAFIGVSMFILLLWL